MKRAIDARGLSCPLPVIEAKKALKELEAGELDVVVDNTISLQNLEKMAKQMGLSYQLRTADENEHVIVITVGEGEARVDTEDAKALTKKPGGTVVVLASNTMGSGDPELGRVLMNSFLYTLTELDELPAKVLLYNSGVKLAVEGAESLTDLKNLAQQGVEILSCGTCLDFYQLTARLGVGSVTNMYEIVQTSMEAQSIIQP